MKELRETFSKGEGKQDLRNFLAGPTIP